MAGEVNRPVTPEELFRGFSKLNREERFQRLEALGALAADDVRFLRAGAPVPIEMAEKFIENTLGFFQMPLGVATNFEIDGRACVIPMVVEETSIIAAASKTAKWIREHGSITTEVLGKDIIGQIQIARAKDYEKLEAAVATHGDEWIRRANVDVAAGLVARGGGVKRLSLRKLDRGDGGVMAVIHVYADACDAMGANIINQVCEYLKEPVEAATGESVTMCILSNLVDSRVTRATVEMRGIEPELMERIEEAALFANLDPYRAATNNKGVLNGIDPILIATGNDWRAVEAGVHAFAARSGQYRSITDWRRKGDALVGVIEAPIILGIVGGVTTLHPTAKMCLRWLDVDSAAELSRICAAVGLVQNLGALRALTTVGVIEGHMKLHIKNLGLGAGASETEMPFVQRRLEEILSQRKRVSLSNAIDVLTELRRGEAEA